MYTYRHIKHVRHSTRECSTIIYNNNMDSFLKFKYTYNTRVILSYYYAYCVCINI